MVKYILISQKFEGYVELAYNKAGYLVHFDNCTWDMTEAQHIYLLRELRNCLCLDDFKRWAADRGYKYLVVPVDLSFERFWREFDMARNRFKAEPMWAKANDERRLYSLQQLAAYKYYCEVNKSWYNHMHADGFLKEHWRDEWYKIKPPERK